MYMQRSMGADDEMSEETKSCLQWLSKLALKGLNLGESGLPQLVFEKKEVDKVSTRMDCELINTFNFRRAEINTMATWAQTSKSCIFFVLRNHVLLHTNCSD